MPPAVTKLRVRDRRELRYGRQLGRVVAARRPHPSSVGVAAFIQGAFVVALIAAVVFFVWRLSMNVSQS